MNYAHYFVLEKKMKNQGFHFERPDLILQFTSGAKESLTELSHYEYIEFLRWINISFLNNTNPLPQNPNEEKKNRMRRKIISYFHKMNVKNSDGKIDLERVNHWCIKYGHKHSPLNQYNYNELCLLLTQVEKYYKSFIQAL